MGLVGKPILNLPNYDCVTFSSPTAFSLSIIGSPLWDGTVEYSTNGLRWDAWSGTTTISSAQKNGENIIYVRGRNNTFITGLNAATDNGAWHFSGSDISVSGELICLLDHQKRTTPAEKAFDSLFGWKSPGDTAIVSASGLILPTALSVQCCRSLFSRCKGLKTPPKFPAITAVNCFETMFYQCEALDTLPVLSALSLADGCYRNLFMDCTSIKLSTTKTGDYQNEFRVPASGTGTSGTDSMVNMFYNTGGTFTGDPSVNTTYYTSNEIVS